MNVKIQGALCEWCCLYLFCRLIQATSATYLLQSLGKPLNSVALLNSQKNDGPSPHPLPMQPHPSSETFTGQSLSAFSQCTSWLGFSPQHLPHTVGCLSRTRHERINLSASSFLPTISPSELGDDTLTFHAKLDQLWLLSSLSSLPQFFQLPVSSEVEKQSLETCFEFVSVSTRRETPKYLHVLGQTR